MFTLDDIIAGSHLAGARMIRLIEDNEPHAVKLLESLYSYAGNAFIIGITGPPGAGKSTLINALIHEFLRLNKKVAVIAVDPTSPYTGGAILGDRLRMQCHAADKKVFIRSMASRGRAGGLSRTTKDALIVLDAMGFDIIIVETIGAGQAEFDVADLTHCLGIVCTPSGGDGIQTIKAGILETGDIFIINKSDRPDADMCFNQLENMLEMKKRSNPCGEKQTWQPKIFKTTASKAYGIKELAQGFLSYLKLMESSDLFNCKKRQLARSYFNTLLHDLLLDKINVFIKDSKEVKLALKDIDLQKKDPVSAARKIAEKTWLRHEGCNV